MGEQFMSSVVAVGMAIIGVAILAVLVSRNSQTTQVLGAAGSVFNNALGTALSPITGGSAVGGGTFTGNSIYTGMGQY